MDETQSEEKTALMTTKEEIVDIMNKQKSKNRLNHRTLVGKRQTIGRNLYPHSTVTVN